MRLLKWSNLFTVIFLAMASSGNTQEYIGSTHCGRAHPENYGTWQVSGHHFALNSVNAGPPTFPFEYHPGTTNVPTPPMVSGAPLAWDDVSYVLGGFYRRANFTDSLGYLLTGNSTDSTQWNIWDSQWAPYHAGEPLAFDCGRCHATGFSDSGHQGNLPGIDGTWAEDGVGCEACHGPMPYS